MVLISTIAVLLTTAALRVQAVDQVPLQDGSGNLDPKATSSIKSIFDSFSPPSGGNARLKPDAVTACCGEGCPIGLCNGRAADSFKPSTGAAAAGTATTPTAAADSSLRVLDFAPTATACCSRSCPDGHCRLNDAVPTYTPGGVSGSFPGRPGRPGLPDPLFPGRPDSGCPGGCGRECGISCPCVCAKMVMTSISVAQEVATTTTTTITGSPAATAKESPVKAAAKDAEAAGAGKSSEQLDYELTAYFHTTELAGLNQDVIPVVVETQSKDPVTLLADIDLALMENYISSFFVQSLNLSSSLTALPKKPAQPAVALGVDGFLVTPHSTIKLNLLAGPAKALKKFPDVAFNVFDLPVAELKGKWEPELFLGVTFLRQARALTLTKDFAGQGAVPGVPVLARDVVVSDHGWDGAVLAKSGGGGAAADGGAARDEL